MNFLFFFICLVYSLPSPPISVPITSLFRNVARGQERTKMIHATNFKFVPPSSSGRRNFKFWMPESLYLKSVLKQRVPHDPALAISGFPKGRSVKFTAYRLENTDKYIFTSELIKLKNYRLNSNNQFFKSGEPVQTRIKLEGYVKGKNIILTERISFSEENPPSPELLARHLGNEQILDLELVKRYPSSIPRMSIVSGTDSISFYPVVPPAEFWGTNLPVKIVPEDGFTTIRAGDLGAGFYKFDADMKLKVVGSSIPVKITFVVTFEADHLEIKYIDKIVYQSSYRDPVSILGDTHRRTGGLIRVQNYFNEEVFHHRIGFPAATNSHLGNLEGQVTEPLAIGFPVQEVVGNPVLP